MTAPAETMTAMAPLGVNGSGLVPSLTMVPLLSRTVIVPLVSLFRQPASAGDPHVVLVLFLKLFDTPYHSLSPSRFRPAGRAGREQSATQCRAADWHDVAYLDTPLAKFPPPLP